MTPLQMLNDVSLNDVPLHDVSNDVSVNGVSLNDIYAFAGFHRQEESERGRRERERVRSIFGYFGYEACW